MDAPADRLVRAIAPSAADALHLLRADDDDEMPTLHGRFTVYDEWTEIDSWFEGRFLERIARGAFAETFVDDRSSFRVLFNHGADPSIGRKVLGPIDSLEERADGPYYEVPLLDTSYNRDLVPGLRAGQYGASFMFRVTGEEWDDEPGESDHNPHGLPERTITKVRLYEFGPVTFPAYQSATAGVRSLTDQFSPDALRVDPSERWPPSVDPAEGRPGRDTAAARAAHDHRARTLRDLQIEGARS